MNTVLIGNLAVIDLRERYPSRYAPRGLGSITTIITHHSDSPTLPASASVEQEIAALDAIHAYHSRPDWPSPGDGGPGVAYNMAHFPSGRSYLIGSWATVRWHSGGAANVYGLAVLWHGDFTDTPPPEPMITTGANLYANIRYQLGKGDMPAIGHQEVNATTCPGHPWPQWKPRLQPSYQPPPVPESNPDATREQLNTLWGIAESLGGSAEWQIKQSVIALKDALGMN